MLPETSALPSNDEIEVAPADHYALFGGDAHLIALRRQRVEALGWMRRLAQWEPLLVGGVAAGWASEHQRRSASSWSPTIRSRSRSRSPARASRTRRCPRSAGDPAAHLRIDSPRAAVRLAILTPQQRRNRPRQSDELRLGTEALNELLAHDDHATAGAPHAPNQ